MALPFSNMMNRLSMGEYICQVLEKLINSARTIRALVQFWPITKTTNKPLPNVTIPFPCPLSSPLKIPEVKLYVKGKKCSWLHKASRRRSFETWD